jgi:phytoene dehydrogenase-like protein
MTAGAAALYTSLDKTAALLGDDEANYRQLLGPLLQSWPQIKNDVLGPLHFPQYPLKMAKFGLKALQSASHLAKDLYH